MILLYKQCLPTFKKFQHLNLLAGIIHLLKIIWNTDQSRLPRIRQVLLSQRFEILRENVVRSRNLQTTEAAKLADIFCCVWTMIKLNLVLNEIRD